MRREMLINLRDAIRLAEHELGVSELSDAELSVYYDILKITGDGDGVFSSDILRQQNDTKSLPHASYHRVLKSLMEVGIIGHFEERERNVYVLRDEFKPS